MSGKTKLTKARELDRDERSVLSDFKTDDWRLVSIFRSGGGQWRREARQRLKRMGHLETHPELRRVWRITEAGRAALSDLERLP